MINAKETAIIWKEVCKAYNETRWDKTPADTIGFLLKSYNLQQLLETFAAVSKLKKDDGRIWDNYRKEIEKIPTDPLCEVWGHENPLFETGDLDHIHTSHINQLIEEVLKEQRNRAEKE